MPSTFKSFLENWDDFFDVDAWQAERDARGEVVDRQPNSERGQLRLYHGFNRDPQTFNYEFDPSKSEQGMLWFTHNMIRGYDPYEYASSKGRFVLTYILDIEKRSEKVTYQNGKSEYIVPEDMRELAIPTSNSRYMVSFDHLIVLPEGWFFTYKTEKFIGTTQIIHASPSMVSEVG